MGKVIQVLGIYVRINFVTTAYDTNTTLVLRYTGGNQTIGSNSSLLTRTTSGGGPIAINAASGTSFNQVMENAGIFVFVQTGNPVNGDSTIDIHISYKNLTV